MTDSLFRGTLHGQALLLRELTRLYLIDSRTNVNAAQDYLLALSDFDHALAYLSSMANCWNTDYNAEAASSIMVLLDELAEG